MTKLLWPEDEDEIARKLVSEYGLRDGDHVRRLARAVRNQIAELLRGENGIAALDRYGIWAKDLAEPRGDFDHIEVAELKRHLGAFADIQRRLEETYLKRAK